MAMNDNSKKILTYLRGVQGEQVTADDVAAALGLTSRQVNGSFTAFQNKEWGVRTPAEIELEDGTHKMVKFLSLTELGMTVDPDADTKAKDAE